MSVADMWQVVLICTSFFTCILIVTFFVGYSEGKRQGEIQALEERIYSQIIDAIRLKNYDMLNYYSKKNIQAAQEWGKRRGILTKVISEARRQPLVVLKGGKDTHVSDALTEDTDLE